MRVISRLPFIILIFLALISFLISYSSQTVKIKDPSLETNRERWKIGNICKYKMTVEVFQLNAGALEGPFDIEIENDEIVNIRYGSVFGDNQIDQERFESVKNRYKNSLSIDKLFDSVESAFRDKSLLAEQGKPDAVRLEVLYDSQYGYPKEPIYQRTDMTDAYSSSEIKKFEVLNSENSCH